MGFLRDRRIGREFDRAMQQVAQDVEDFMAVVAEGARATLRRLNDIPNPDPVARGLLSATLNGGITFSGQARSHLSDIEVDPARLTAIATLFYAGAIIGSDIPGVQLLPDARDATVEAARIAFGDLERDEAGITEDVIDIGIGLRSGRNDLDAGENVFWATALNVGPTRVLDVVSGDAWADAWPAGWDASHTAIAELTGGRTVLSHPAVSAPLFRGWTRTWTPADVKAHYDPSAYQATNAAGQKVLDDLDDIPF